MNDVSRIFPGFYIGSLPAVNRTNLDNHQITHILSILNEFKPKWTDTYSYLHIDIYDSPSSDIKKYFEKTFEFIEEGRREGAILVHCFAGISRSATICIAYCMRKLKLSYEDAHGLLFDARPIIFPNESFVKQLKKYEFELKQGIIIPIPTNLKFKLYKPSYDSDDEDEEDESDGYDTEEEYQDEDDEESEEEFDNVIKKDKKTNNNNKIIENTTKQISSITISSNIPSLSSKNNTSKITNSTTTTCTIKTKSIIDENENENNNKLINNNNDTVYNSNNNDIDNKQKQEEEEEEEEEINNNKATQGVHRYCCRKCSTDLFVDFDIMDHDQGEGQTAFKHHRRDINLSENKEGVIKKIVCTSYFINEIDFVLSQTGQGMSGKISCLKCNEKLGSYSWSGEQCSCGAWIAPSFQIPKTRVDEKKILTK